MIGDIWSKHKEAYDRKTCIALIEIEKIVFNCEILISCHGWISHIASAKQIKQIDIIDDQYAYDKWTSHFRNYNFLNRASFNVLSQKILQLI